MGHGGPPSRRGERSACSSPSRHVTPFRIWAMITPFMHHSRYRPTMYSTPWRWKSWMRSAHLGRDRQVGDAEAAAEAAAALVGPTPPVPAPGPCPASRGSWRSRRLTRQPSPRTAEQSCSPTLCGNAGAHGKSAIFRSCRNSTSSACRLGRPGRLFDGAGKSSVEVVECSCRTARRPWRNPSTGRSGPRWRRHLPGNRCWPSAARSRFARADSPSSNGMPFEELKGDADLREGVDVTGDEEADLRRGLFLR